MPSECKANVNLLHKKRGVNPSKCKANVNLCQANAQFVFYCLLYNVLIYNTFPKSPMYFSFCAPYITLRIIRDFGDSAFYAYAKAFMQEKDPEYTLDVEVENFEDSDFDRVFKAKYLGVPMQKMRQLVIPQNTKRITGQDYVFASAEDFIKWAVLPYAEINADGNPQVEFTPAYYQAKEECKSFVILNQDSKIIEDGKITFSIWLPKQCWEEYGTQKKEVTLRIVHSNNEGAFDLE